jgi:hypothetical protein
MPIGTMLALRAKYIFVVDQLGECLPHELDVHFHSPDGSKYYQLAASRASALAILTEHFWDRSGLLVIGWMDRTHVARYFLTIKRPPFLLP